MAKLQPIKIFNSVVAGNAPTTSNLGLGELAYNHNDNKLYAVQTTAGTVTSVVQVNSGGGGGSALAIKDEGTTLSTAATSIDFVGAGVTATSTMDAITVTISGGSFDQSNVAITGGTITGLSGLSVNTDIMVRGMHLGVGAAGNTDNLVFGLGGLQNLLPRDDENDYGKSFNVALGTYVLSALESGANNLGIGSLALQNLPGGWDNIGIGAHAGQFLVNGANNVLIGSTAGGGDWMDAWLTDGNDNVLIGAMTRPQNNNDSNSIVIGTNAVGNGSNTIMIGNDQNQYTKIYGNLEVTGSVSSASGGGQGSSILTDGSGKTITGLDVASNFNTGSDSVIIGKNILNDGGTLGAFRTIAIGENILTQNQTVTAGNLVVGQQYVIIDAGDTDFTAIGAGNNNPGSAFYATDVGTGTGTVGCSRGSIFFGRNTGQNNLGSANFGFGQFVLNQNKWGSRNLGFNSASSGSALELNISGNDNVAIGAGSLHGSGALANAGSFIVDKEYQIVDVGDTDFTAIGAGSNTSGVIFTATGAGSGTGTAGPMANCNVAIGNNSGKGTDGSLANATGSDNIFLGCFTSGATVDDDNTIVIGSHAVGLGSNSTMIGTADTILTKVAGKLLIDKAPTTAVGDVGDKEGMIASDASYLYHCNADYDGSTSIWGRVAVTTW